MALVIARKLGKGVRLSQDGKVLGDIKVIQIKGKQVRLRFETKEIKVDRITEDGKLEMPEKDLEL